MTTRLLAALTLILLIVWVASTFKLVSIPLPAEAFEPLTALLPAITSVLVGFEYWLSQKWGTINDEVPDGVLTTTAKQRNNILTRVLDTWIDDKLYPSLHDMALMDLQLITDPQAVEHSWELLRVRYNGEQQQLPYGTHLIDVYHDSKDRLLVLGAPGAGKTTLLLQLTVTLLDRAIQDQDHPIPVVLSLSTWSSRYRQLEDWIVYELRKRYRVAEVIGKQWLEQECIILLLDGLDEVKDSQQRISCIIGINTFLETHIHTSMVICSREHEYRTIQPSQRVQVDEAILIQPLSDEHITTFLQNTHGQLQGLAKALQHDLTLHELARTPLMLHIMALVYRDQREEQVLIHRNPAQQREYLFDQYIDKMLKEKGPSEERFFRSDAPLKASKDQHARSWLSWLAYNMEHLPEASIFYLDRLQPNWLSTSIWYWTYMFSSRIITSYVLGFALCLSIVAVGGIHYVLFCLLAGSIVAIIDGYRFIPRIARHPNQPLSRGRPHLLQRVFDGSLTSLLDRVPLGTKLYQILKIWCVIGVCLGMFFGLVLEAPPQDRLFGFLTINGVNLGIFFGMFYGTLFGLRANKPEDDFQPDDIRPVEKFEWSTARAIKGAGRYSISLAGFCAVMAYSLGLTQAQGNRWLLVMSERTFGWGQDWLPTAPALVQITVFALMTGALLGGVFGGIIEGMRTPVVAAPKGKRNDPYEGVRLSVHNALLTVGIYGTIFGSFFFIVLFGVAHGSMHIYPVQAIATQSILNGISFGIIVALWNGGIDVIQHYTIRMILYGCGYIPSFSYVDFLDYAARCVLLHKTGGGYTFLHRSLSEHFAALGERYPLVYESQWRGIQVRSVLGSAAVLVLMVLVTSNIARMAYATHQPPTSSHTKTYYLQIGDNIETLDGIVCDGSNPHCPTIALLPHDTVLIQASWWIHTGQFVTWVGPDGTNAGFLGFPIEDVWNIPAIPDGTLHGALLCRSTAEATWHVCGSHARFQIMTQSFLALNINDIDRKKFQGRYYISVQVIRSSVVHKAKP